MAYNKDMKTVIFGCGKIAKRIAKGFEFVKDNELVGFGSKDIDKAKAYSLEFNVSLYGDYDYFLNNQEIDVVDVATYNLNHYELIKKCLLHKKHVMSEKPMVSSIEELNELYDIAKQNNVLLFEGVKSLYLPIILKVKEMINSKTIGDVYYLEASFIRGPRHPESHWIYDLKTGGALKDLGSYCASTLNFLLDLKPDILYKYKNNTDTLADTIAEVNLDYKGVKGHILVSNEISGDSSLKVLGTRGYIIVPDFWKTSKGYYELDKVRYELNEECINDFSYEINHFTSLILNKKLESDVMSKEFSINVLEVTK